jgi:hypothetical protein
MLPSIVLNDEKTKKVINFLGTADTDNPHDATNYQLGPNSMSH